MSLPRLHLDYHVPQRRPMALGYFLLAVSIAGAGALGREYLAAKSELERLEASRSLLAGERAPAPRKELEADLKAADAVRRQLALPWAAMVQAVESSATKDVAVLQMQPDARERQLRLGAEARSEKAMLEYLRRLAAHATLTDVQLVAHQVVADDPQRPLQFTVLARLRGPQ